MSFLVVGSTTYLKENSCVKIVLPKSGLAIGVLLYWTTYAQN